MMMKRLVAAVCAVSFSSVALVGCSSGSDLLKRDTYLEGKGDLRPVDDIARDVSKAIEKEGPAAYEAALAAAQEHIDEDSFSYEALIEQLKLDGFAEEAITYAMDHVNADYGKEAKEALKHIEDTTGLTTEDMVDLLVTDGFTREAIKYAMKNY